MSVDGFARDARQILFFTSEFPAGLGEEWKRSEVLALVDEGWHVHVVPLTQGAQDGATLPDEVVVHPPLLQRGAPLSGALTAWLHFFAACVRELPIVLRRPPRKRRVRAFIRSTLDNARVMRSVAALDIPQADWRVLYFYWGRGAAEATSSLRSLLQPDRVVVRLHGYDLYADRAAHGYLPYRSDVWSADVICTVSNHGAEWLTRRHPELSVRTQVRRLGSHRMPAVAPQSVDGGLRAVSCAMLRPVKRVHEIPRILAATDFEVVQWTHMGDGPERSSVEEALCQAARVEGRLLGQLSAEGVRQELLKGPHDVFVNVSSSEGVPVSVMEALAAGLPVVATDVGGTSELVDESVGRLVERDFRVHDVVSAIEAVMDPEFRRGVAQRAKARHAAMCDAGRLAKEMIAEVFSPPTRPE